MLSRAFVYGQGKAVPGRFWPGLPLVGDELSRPRLG